MTGSGWLSGRRAGLASCATLLAVALVASACGGGSPSATSSSAKAAAAGPFGATKNSQIASQVPSAVRSSQPVTIATDASYAPNEFFAPDNTTIIGMDVDLGNAMAAVMGLKFHWVNAGFDGIIPGLASGKYGLGISSFTDTLERQKTVDFVTYFKAGTSFVVKASGGPDITSLSQLCGMTVSVETGTTEQADATAQSKKCTQDGKKAVTVLNFQSQNGANLALSTGRSQVMMADTPVAAYQVKLSNGQFKLGGEYGVAPYGIAIPKGNGMAAPIQAALKELMSNGIYMKILKKWGVEAGAIDNPQVNAATS